MSDGSKPWWHGQLTQVSAIHSIERELISFISRKYSGWRVEDREDLVSLVLEKYLDEFGKDDEKWPENAAGVRVVPGSWLRTVATRAAIDMHRRREARPADPVDFNADGTDDWDMRSALRELATPSLMAARGVAAERALNSLSDTDRDLLRWALVDDLALVEIQKQTGKTYDATKKAVQNAKARLRRVVSENPELRDILMDRPEYPLI